MSLQTTLVELGFSQQEAQEYCDLFREHDVTQNELMSLDHELLKEMGVSKIGHRIRLLKLKQMRESVPTSYKDEYAPKKAAPGRKKKVVEPETVEVPVPVPVPEPKPKRPYKKRELMASKTKAKLEDTPVFHGTSADHEVKPIEPEPATIAPVQEVFERPKPVFSLRSFDLPDDIVFGSKENSPQLPKHVPYSLDEGFSLEIPSSFSKGMQLTAATALTTNNNYFSNNTNTTTQTDSVESKAPVKEQKKKKNEEHCEEEKKPKEKKRKKKVIEEDDEEDYKYEVEEDKPSKPSKDKKKKKIYKENRAAEEMLAELVEETRVLKEKKKKDKKKPAEKEAVKDKESRKQRAADTTKQPIVTEPSDEEDSEEDEASQQSLEEYIADEVMQIDPEEASALDLVLQNDADQGEAGDDHAIGAVEEEDDYMKILNDKVTKSLVDGLNVKDIMKGTPNKLKQIVIDSFIDIEPRKHQWEAVYNIVRDILMHNYVAELDGQIDGPPPIRNYLIQHSAGSGKSLTIACLVYMLYMLKDDKDKYKFDFIIVLNDRKVLDEQLGKTVKKFLRTNGVKTGVKQAGKAADLNSLLVDNNKSRVVMSTVQKFGQLLTKNKLDKTIAIIADEAHRTHGRSSTRHVHEFLTGATRQSESITYFSFTCTPTPKALEMFGVKHGITYSPFCTYSMQQALHDKVIMNVLEDYTSVAAIAQIEPSAMEAITKTYEKGLEATKTLMKATEDDRQVLREKAKYIVNHFVKKRKELSNDKFTAKGMLVTGSRKHIIWYKQEIETLIRALPEEDQFEVVAAFTSFTFEGKKVTQDDEAVNGEYAGRVLQEFKKKNNLVKMIIVADKLRTGFDEPKLALMYIDRKLKGTNAVQTLGRLNRVAPGKESVSVVDFVNSRKQISEAFGQYWATTTLVDMSGRDPMQKKLDDVAHKLLQIEGVRDKDLKKSVNAIIMEDFERKKQGARTVERELNSFANMCDRLQIEHPELSYKFAVDLKNALFVEYKSRLTKAREILGDISLRVDGMRLVNQGSIHVNNSNKDLRYNAIGAKIGEISEPSMNVGQIVNSVNEANFVRLLQMKDNPKGMAIPLSVAVEEDFSNDNLEFAKGIWSRRQRPRSVSDIRKNKAAEVPSTNTTAEEEKRFARELESELMTMSNKAQAASTAAVNPVKQLVPAATNSSFQIKKLLQQHNPRENFKPKIAGELTKSAGSSSGPNTTSTRDTSSDSAHSSKTVSPALLPQPAPVSAAVKQERSSVDDVPMEIDPPSIKQEPVSKGLSPAKRKIDQVEASTAASEGGSEPSEEPERKKLKTENEPSSPSVIDLSTPPELNEDPMEDHDNHVLSSYEDSSPVTSPTRVVQLTDEDKIKLSAFLKMIETTKYNAKDRQKVLRALLSYSISAAAQNYLREINAIDVLVREFLIPISPNSLQGVAICRSVAETALAASCLYELARNRTNAELIANKALGHIIGMLAQKSDLQILSAKLLGILCVNDEINQLIGSRSISTLILLLNVPDEVVINETARTLRTMTKVAANAQLIVECGGVPILVNLMGAKSMSTCLMAIKTLHDLCQTYPPAIELVKAEKMTFRYLPKWTTTADHVKHRTKALALNQVLGITIAEYNAARKKWPELNAPLRRSNEPAPQQNNLTRSRLLTYLESKTEPTPPTNASELPPVVTRAVIITPPKAKALSRTTPATNPLTKSAEGLRVIVANQSSSKYPVKPSHSSRGPAPRGGFSSRGPPPRGRGSRGGYPYSPHIPPPPPPHPSSLRHSTGTRGFYRGPSPPRARPRYRSRSRDRRSGPRSRSPSRSRDRYRRSRSRSRGRSWSRSPGRSRSFSRSRSRSRDRKRYSRSRSRSLSRSRSRDRVRSRERK